MEKIILIKLKRRNKDMHPILWLLSFLPIFSYFLLDRKIVGLYYNIEEDGYYYRINKNFSGLRKDLSRSLEMLEGIVDRLMIFDYDVKKINNFIDPIINKIIDGYDTDQATYLLLGSHSYSYKNLSKLLIKFFTIDPRNKNLLVKGKIGTDIIIKHVHKLIDFMQNNLKEDTIHNITLDEMLDSFK